jgi:hypothetical protein
MGLPAFPRSAGQDVRDRLTAGREAARKDDTRHAFAGLFANRGYVCFGQLRATVAGTMIMPAPSTPLPDAVLRVIFRGSFKEVIVADAETIITAVASEFPGLDWPPERKLQ